MNFNLLKNVPPAILFGIAMDKLLHRKLSGWKNVVHLFENKCGIEIGGPSAYFSTGHFLPVYAVAKSVDGCNFSNETAWEGTITQGQTYEYAPGKIGMQFICEGADVNVIPKGRYDFLLSCNNLEHIANPLKAVRNWHGLLKDEGTIVLILPRKESNFDRRRMVTSFEHLISDFENNTGENDLTHLDEILKSHDLKLDPRSGGIEKFKQRSIDNFFNRCLHHHIFDMPLLERMGAYFKLSVIAKQTITTDHIIILKKGK